MPWAYLGVRPAQRLASDVSHTHPAPVFTLCVWVVPAAMKEDQNSDPTSLPKTSQAGHPALLHPPCLPMKPDQAHRPQGATAQSPLGRYHVLEVDVLCFGSLFLEEP